jgi:hypothetical protein
VAGGWIFRRAQLIGGRAIDQAGRLPGGDVFQYDTQVSGLRAYREDDCGSRTLRGHQAAAPDAAGVDVVDRPRRIARAAITQP